MRQRYRNEDNNARLGRLVIHYMGGLSALMIVVYAFLEVV